MEKLIENIKEKMNFGKGKFFLRIILPLLIAMLILLFLIFDLHAMFSSDNKGSATILFIALFFVSYLWGFIQWINFEAECDQCHKWNSLYIVSKNTIKDRENDEIPKQNKFFHSTKQQVEIQYKCKLCLHVKTEQSHEYVIVET